MAPAEAPNIYEGIVSHISRLVCAGHAEASWATKDQEQVPPSPPPPAPSPRNPSLPPLHTGSPCRTIMKGLLDNQ